MLSFSPSQSLSSSLHHHHRPPSPPLHHHHANPAPSSDGRPRPLLLCRPNPARHSTSVRTTTAHPPLLLPRVDCFTTRKIVAASQATTKPPPREPLLPHLILTALSDPPKPPAAAEPLPRRRLPNSLPHELLHLPLSPPLASPTTVITHLLPLVHFPFRGSPRSDQHPLSPTRLRLSPCLSPCRSALTELRPASNALPSTELTAPVPSPPTTPRRPPSFPYIWATPRHLLLHPTPLPPTAGPPCSSHPSP